MLRLLLLISCIFISSFSFAEIKRIEDKTPEIIEALTELSNQIPQHYLSLDAVAEHNEYDEKKIIGWLSKNIQYTPSPGYQLTPEKSLQTATGNALEQAILLQNILIQAGFESRIAKAQLDEATATTLLKQSFIPSPANQWEFSDEVREQYLKKLAVLYGQRENALLDDYKELGELIQWKKSKLYQDAGKLSKTLYNAIEKQGAWNIPKDGVKPWIDIARDYYFVKYRLGQGDKWSQAHPAFIENVPTIKNSSYFTEDISSQYHQITLQAFITRQTEGKEKETIAVTPLIKRSSLQLFEHQLTFATVPSKFQEALDNKSIELIYKSKYFLPVVDGDLLENTRAFSLDGQDYAAKDIFDPTHKFFNTVNDKTKELTSTLDKLEKPTKQNGETSEQSVSSVLLDYYFKISWKAPNGDSRELKRNIYLQKEKQTEKSKYNDISQRVLLAAEPAILSIVAQSKEQLNTQISIFQLLHSFKEQEFSQPQIISKINQWYKALKDSRFNQTLALSRQNKSKQQFFSAIPMLAMIWVRDNYINDQINITTSFDYLINAAQIVEFSDKTIAIDSTATLEHGVWSTYSEALVQSAILLKGGSPLSRENLPNNVVSAAGQFNQATKNDQKFEIISSVKQLELLPQINRAAKDLLQTELRKTPQNIYFLPKVRPDKGYLSYYRVNTQTGETLGYSEFGQGDVSDYAINTWARLRIVMSGAGGVLGMAGCAKNSMPADKSFSGFGACMACVAVTSALAVYSVGGSEIIKTIGKGVGLSCSAVGFYGGFN